MKISIVGCGLSGITAASYLTRKGYDVEIFETRNHIGGNCYDFSSHGNTVHKYGPHLFHTNDSEVFSYLSEFTEWVDFEYRPVGNTSIGLISLPYSKKTIREIGRELSDNEIREIILRQYSEKLWGTSLESLPQSILSRVKNLKNEENPTWFGSDKHQCLPKCGYTKMFEAMLDGVVVHLGCRDNEWRNHKYDVLIYTGKIDDFFFKVHGSLPYRSIDFKIDIGSERMPYFAENQNNNRDYVRVCDYSHLGNGSSYKIQEYPLEHNQFNIPYYPKNFGYGQELFSRYNSIPLDKNVIFLGRLCTYKYLDMWMVVKQALRKIENI